MTHTSMPWLESLLYSCQHKLLMPVQTHWVNVWCFVPDFRRWVPASGCLSCWSALPRWRCAEAAASRRAHQRAATCSCSTSSAHYICPCKQL
jgi:hypothetical protein